MASPFPGVDPFIESQRWETFHSSLIIALQQALTYRVRPRYTVEVEERIYLEHDDGDAIRTLPPDVTVLQPQPGSAAGEAGAVDLVGVTPIVMTLPIPDRRRETYLTIRRRGQAEVVTAIEVLSPGHKRPGSDGQRDYLHKREAMLLSASHLVELDLLRSGERLPTVESLPPADYYAFVCCADRRPTAEVYAWQLEQPLPIIPIPLADGDPDVTLDLQALCSAVYDRAGDDYALDYARPVEPPLSGATIAWAQQRLAAERSRSL